MKTLLRNRLRRAIFFGIDVVLALFWVVFLGIDLVHQAPALAIAWDAIIFVLMVGLAYYNGHDLLRAQRLVVAARRVGIK